MFSFSFNSNPLNNLFINEFQLNLLSFILILSLFLIIYFWYRIFTFNNKFVDLSYTKVNQSLYKADNDSQELPPHYPNGWIPALESKSIGINQIHNFRAFGHQLAAFRGQSGRAHVLDAFCPHLGANIGVGGKVVSQLNEDCIRCPFHGWSFRGKDGICVNVPELHSSEIPSARIKVWETHEINNIIFVWYHSEGVKPFWFPNQINQIHENQWKYEGRTEHIVNCHFQEIPENGPDMAHLEELHSPAVMAGNVLNKNLFYELLSKVLYHEWESEWWTDPTKDKHIAHMVLSNRNKIFGLTALQIKFTVRQIGPAFVELSYKSDSFGGISGAFLQMVTPIEPKLNRIVHNIYAEPTLKGKLLAKFLLYGELRMIERDIIIWNNKKFLQNPIFTKNEKSLKRFRRWFKQFYTEEDIQQKISLKSN